MAIEEKAGSGGAIATVVATAAVTLAIGVTAAGLGGYLVPTRGGGETKSVVPSEPIPTEARVIAPTTAPAVVLVPVAQDSPSGARPSELARPGPEMQVAAYAPTEHSEGRPGHKRHERKHENEHDDD